MAGWRDSVRAANEPVSCHRPETPLGAARRCGPLRLPLILPEAARRGQLARGAPWEFSCPAPERKEGDGAGLTAHAPGWRGGQRLLPPCARAGAHAPCAAAAAAAVCEGCVRRGRPRGPASGTAPSAVSEGTRSEAAGVSGPRFWERSLDAALRRAASSVPLHRHGPRCSPSLAWDERSRSWELVLSVGSL